MIDLRSDTVTKPGAGMRRAMAAAEVGDDVFGEDPTVNRLQDEVAALLGKEAALFCPSGTMANLVSVAAATAPGDEVLLDTEAHILNYELAGASMLAGVQLRAFDAPLAGCPDQALLERLRRVADPDHEPRTALLCLEQTHNRRGGTVTPLDRLQQTCAVAHEMGLLVHIDGARLANAATALGCTPAQLVAQADSATFSLSKGLGCPLGTVWVGSAASWHSAHLWRKRLGGGMRQAGIMAAAGLYALEHNLQRLAEDHATAMVLARALGDVPGAQFDVEMVQTNIVLIRTDAPAAQVVERAAEVGVLMVAFGARTVRCVTHLDVSAADIREAATRLQGAFVA